MGISGGRFPPLCQDICDGHGQVQRSANAGSARQELQRWVSFLCPDPPAPAALQAGAHLVSSVKAFLITLALKIMAFCLHQT